MNYEKIYNSIIENRKLNVPIGYVEEHHIVPSSIGGTNEKSNLVCLTAKEHFICHLLLTKMYKYGTLEYYKMCHAFLMMLVHSTSHNGNRYISSRKYEQLKVSFSERMSIIQMGKGNSQYGTMWIHNKTLKQSKKVANDTIIDDGWEKGRVLNWNKVQRINKKEKPPKITHINRPCSVCDKIGCVSKLSKFCSDECKKSTHTFELDMYIDKFIEYYKEHKSINKALKLLGKSGTAGEYYYWAVRTIENCLDSEVKEIYNRNVK